MRFMKDKFEKFIAENREAFDILEPGPGVWNKIENQIRKKRSISWRQILQRAALVAVIFAASYVVNEMIHRYYNHNKDTATAAAGKGPVVPGLREAEAYYAGLVNQKMDELKPVMAKCPVLEQELKYDMTELDSVYSDLKNDLKDNMANQEVIEAIIENYRLKISILEDLLTEIKPREEECLSKTDSHAL
jgi:hypothetical protein